MDDAARDLAAAQAAADAELRRLIAPLGPKLAALVRQFATVDAEGAAVLTHAARARIMAEVDRLLAPVFGARRGDDSALADLIVFQANAARRRPIARAGRELARRVPDDLYAAMERGE